MNPAGEQRLRQTWLLFCAFGLGLLILLLPLPAGSNRPQSLHLLLLAAAGLGIALALPLLLARSRSRPLDALQQSLIVLWLLWLGWIALQQLALPPALLERWSPAAYRAYASAVASDAAAVATLSVARVDTAQLFLLSVAYAVLFLCALLLREPRARAIVLYAVILAAAAQALFGLAMLYSGLELGPFGPKTSYRGSATGTFVNRNHYAGFIEIGAALTLGLMIARMRGSMLGASRLRLVLRNLVDSLLSRSWWLRLILLLLIVALIASRSRMGNAAFAGAVLLAVPLYLVVAPGPGRIRVLILVALIAAIDVGVVGTRLGLEDLLDRFRSSGLATEMRLSTFADLGDLIRDWGWLGAGLGSFAYIYPSARAAEVYAFNDHAHNDYAQFLIETGVPGVTLLAGIVALVLLRCLQILRHRHDPATAGLALGVLLAMFSLGLHSLTDFNLQIPANAATLVILMGLAAGQSSRTPVRRRVPRQDNGGSADAGDSNLSRNGPNRSSA